MEIDIISIGKFRQNSLQEIFADYVRKTPWNVQLKELEIKSGKFSSAELKQKEGELILKTIDKKSLLILLDEKGKSLSSREFAGLISKYQISYNKITFVIAGADGASEELKQRADSQISLSKMTFPHLLVRIFLAEQLYRANLINSNHPYHRD